MRIAIVTSVHTPFDIRIYHKQYTSLKKRYKDITIIVPNQVELAKKDRTFISFRGFENFWLRAVNNFIIMTKCVRLKPGLIIFHDPDLLPFMISYKLFNPARIIYDIHEDYPNYFLQNEKLPGILRKLIKNIYIVFEKTAKQTLDHLIYADHFTAEFYHKNFRKKISVVYNYPIVKEYRRTEKIYDLICQGSLHGGVHKRLLNILEELDKNSDREIKCMIIGRNASDQIKNEIRQLSQKLIHVKIIYDEDIPYSEVQEYVEKARIGLTPWPQTKKFDRNIPTKIFEYLMHSIPQVASKTPSIFHYLQWTESGFCIEHQDYAAGFAVKILDILHNYSEFEARAKTDYEMLKKQWTWNPKEEGKFLDIIAAVCQLESADSKPH